MTKLKFIAALTSTTFLSFAAQAAVTPQTLPIDKPTTVNDIRLECLGVGMGDRGPSVANNYSVRLETVGGYGQYLANDNITLRNRQGRQLLNVNCNAPWLLIKLDPGRYNALVKIPRAASKEVWFSASDHGLRNVYVSFRGKMAGQENHVVRPASAGITNETRKKS